MFWGSARQSRRLPKPPYNCSVQTTCHTGGAHGRAGSHQPAIIMPAVTQASLQGIPVISIVDDDEGFREAMKSLLRSLGFGVLTFKSAEDFLESDRRYDAECLIVDVNMPGLSGFELQEHLFSRGCDTPIIFVTAFAEERIRARAQKSGAAGLLSKPFSESCLIDCLNNAMKRGAGH